MAGTGNRIKVILVGDSSVGKTSIHKLYEYRTVAQIQWPATLGLTSNITNIVVGEGHHTIELEMADTGGSEQFRATTVQYYRNTDIALLVYDITRKKTAQNLDGWVHDIKKYSHNEDIKIILIGNKLDMEKKREVKCQDMDAYAKRNDMLFFEMSAKIEDHCQLVDDIIRRVAGHTMQQRIRSRSIGATPLPTPSPLSSVPPSSSAPPSVSPTSPSSPPVEQGNNNNEVLRLQEEEIERPRKKCKC